MAQSKYCYVPRAFTNKLMLYPFLLRDCAQQGMSDAMQHITRMARREARWNPDGTDTGSWLVTGKARQALFAYALGETPPAPSFNFTDPVYGSAHISPGATYDPITGDPEHIVGVVTMSEQHSAALQDYEIGGTTSGKSSLTAGEPITRDVLTNHKDFVWNTIAAVVKVGMRI
jgi:hypothetical protein